MAFKHASWPSAWPLNCIHQWEKPRLKHKGVYIMEFLKDFLSEDTYAKVAEELKGKEVKLANLKSGEYVAKDKYTALEGSYNDIKGQLTNKSAEYNELLTKVGDNEALKAEIENLKTTSTEALNKTTATYEAKLKQSAIISGLTRAKVKDPKDLFGQLDLDKITYENDEIKGLDEQLTPLKENKPYLFNEETPKGKGGLDHNDGADDDADINSMRAVVGLPPINN